MKNKFKPFLLGFLLLFVFEGCSNDENESFDASGNIMKYESNEYPTPNGMLVFKELINTNLCLYDLKLYSSNFTFNPNNGEVTGISGTGQIITFYVISPIQLTDVNADGMINEMDIVLNNLILSEGNYSFSSDYISRTFEADFAVKASSSNEYEIYSIESGTLTISKSEDIYKISYNLLDENSLRVSGYFEGKLNAIRNAD